MKKAADKFVRIFAAVLAVLSVSILLFTLVSTLFLNRTDKEWFGYKAFIVLSDSMSATDFSAGDLVFVRPVDPSTLQPGDIIAFTSRNDSNYGDTVTHKIRALTTTADGAPGFTTYGTTTDTDDEAVVPYSDVIGRYAGHLPKVGLFFNFLKTTPGYLLCVFLPFALLILSQAVQTVRLFRAYRREQAGAGDSDAFALPEPQSGAEIAARLAAGEDVTLQADTAFTDADGHCIDCVIAPGKAAVLHLNGHRLKGTIQLADGAALTVHGKGMIQATARSHSRAIGKHRNLLQQILVQISRIHPHVAPCRLHTTCDFCARSRLLKRIATRKRYAGNKLVLKNALHHIIDGNFFTRIKSPALGVMTPRTMMRTPLNEHGKTHARTINDGIVYCTKKAYCCRD